MHKEWHSRGYLPHFDHPDLIQFITFRLHDSVPSSVVEKWRFELKLTGMEDADDPRCAELRKRIEQFADAGHGACWLKQPEVAEIIQQALLHFDGTRYRLLSWCIMPNHVHVLIETVQEYSLSTVVQSWKSFTAKACNKQLNRNGTFWMADYFDRYIRNAEQLTAVKSYILQNPVKANMCTQAEEWKWSSR